MANLEIRFQAPLTRPGIKLDKITRGGGGGGDKKNHRDLRDLKLATTTGSSTVTGSIFPAKRHCLKFKVACSRLSDAKEKGTHLGAWNRLSSL